jgi:membrane-associated phospholipid phosphatase
MLLADTVSLSVLGAIGGPAVAAAVTGDTAWTWLFVGLLGVNAAVAGFKRLIGGGEWPWGRPIGARGCGALCDGGTVSGAPGFPSGHVATVAMLVTVAALWYQEELAVALFGLVWLSAVAWSRWVKLCHNGVQIAGGVIFGAICGMALAFFVQPK